MKLDTLKDSEWRLLLKGGNDAFQVIGRRSRAGCGTSVSPERGLRNVQGRRMHEYDTYMIYAVYHQVCTCFQDVSGAFLEVTKYVLVAKMVLVLLEVMS